jgi:hypothetical protein
VNSNSGPSPGDDDFSGSASFVCSGAGQSTHTYRRCHIYFISEVLLKKIVAFRRSQEHCRV